VLRSKHYLESTAKEVSQEKASQQNEGQLESLRSQAGKREQREHTNNRHSLANIVEIKNSQEFVDFCFSHFHDGDGLRCASPEHKSKVSGSSDKSSLIRRLGLIHQVT